MSYVIRFAGLMLFTFAAAYVLQHLSAAGHWGYFANLGALSLAIAAIGLLHMLSGQATNRRRSEREGEGRPKPLV